MKIEYSGEGNLFLHQLIGEGKLPDGREIRLIQTNTGIHMQVYPLKGEEKGKWKTFSLSYMAITEGFVKHIKQFEKGTKVP